LHEVKPLRSRRTPTPPRSTRTRQGILLAHSRLPGAGCPTHRVLCDEWVSTADGRPEVPTIFHHKRLVCPITDIQPEPARQYSLMCRSRGAPTPFKATPAAPSQVLVTLR